jgi:hypothetical protein
MRRKKLSILLLLLISSPLCCQLAPDQFQPVFYFGGQRISIGMPEDAARAALRACCELNGSAGSYFIVSKDTLAKGIVGSIFFAQGRVAFVSQDLATDVDSSDDDLVGFIRDVRHNLPEGSHLATVTLKHQDMSNAQSDVLTIVFENGRGIELRLATLDKPDATTHKRDYVTVEATAQPR